MPRLTIHFGDNLTVLSQLPDACVDLIYIDPPFNTGKVQSRTQISTIRDEEGGDRTGFQGKRYRTVKLGTKQYHDYFDDYLVFLGPRLIVESASSNDWSESKGMYSNSPPGSSKPTVKILLLLTTLLAREGFGGSPESTLGCPRSA